MRYLKTFETYISDTNRLLAGKIQDIYDSISLYKVADRIYAVVIEDDYLRGMVFMRCQEFYESSSPEFQGQKFTWNRYMDWYKTDGPGAGKDEFTYGADWAGFNLPSESIEKCMSDIDDPNEYDHCMESIVEAIRSQESSNFYLLGVESLDLNSSVLDHEMAHGFWYTDPEYKSSMFNLIKSCDQESIQKLKDIIIAYGYTESVLPDEVQAYLSTGLASKMQGFGLEDHMPKFEENFLKFKQKHSTTPIQIKVEY
jgi:hypothetical protein